MAVIEAAARPQMQAKLRQAKMLLGSQKSAATRARIA